MWIWSWWVILNLPWIILYLEIFSFWMRSFNDVSVQFAQVARTDPVIPQRAEGKVGHGHDWSHRCSPHVWHGSTLLSTNSFITWSKKLNMPTARWACAHLVTQDSVNQSDPFMLLVVSYSKCSIMNFKHNHILPIHSRRTDTHTNKSLSVQLDTIPLPHKWSRTHLICVNILCLIVEALHSEKISTWMGN